MQITRQDIYYSDLSIIGENSEYIWGTVLQEIKTTIVKNKLFGRSKILRTSEFKRIRIMKETNSSFFRDAETGKFVPDSSDNRSVAALVQEYFMKQKADSLKWD